MQQQGNPLQNTREGESFKYFAYRVWETWEKSFVSANEYKPGKKNESFVLPAVAQSHETVGKQNTKTGISGCGQPASPAPPLRHGCIGSPLLGHLQTDLILY